MGASEPTENLKLCATYMIFLLLRLVSLFVEPILYLNPKIFWMKHIRGGDVPLGWWPTVTPGRENNMVELFPYKNQSFDSR